MPIDPDPSTELVLLTWYETTPVPRTKQSRPSANHTSGVTTQSSVVRIRSLRRTARASPAATEVTTTNSTTSQVQPPAPPNTEAVSLADPKPDVPTPPKNPSAVSPIATFPSSSGNAEP
ncbi:hypothetical protein NYQ34_08995 [Curtobacterium flaccumfaciens pv. flaccumfaciens]|nr:hypothetical protein [Curtobacterium flaccumfaciens pv. flaccumfaciens]